MVDQLASITDTTKSQQATLLPIEGTEAPSTTLIPIGTEHEDPGAPSTTLILIGSEHTSRESSESLPKVFRES